MNESPSGGSPEKTPDGISWVWKVAAVEKWFCGSLDVLGYKSIYIGERSRSVELRGAHEGGGAPTPLGAPSCLVEASRSSILPLQVSWFAFVPEDPREGFVPFGFRLIFLFCETVK